MHGLLPVFNKPNRQFAHFRLESKIPVALARTGTILHIVGEITPIKKHIILKSSGNNCA